MSSRKKRRTPAKARRASVLQHTETAREHVFWASGIVDCCVYATESLLAENNGRPNLQLALEGAHVLLQKAAGALTDVDEPADGGDS